MSSAAYVVCQVVNPMHCDLEVLLSGNLIVHIASKLSYLLLDLVDHCPRASKLGVILTFLVQLLKLKQKTDRRDLWADLSSQLLHILLNCYGPLHFAPSAENLVGLLGWLVWVSVQTLEIVDARHKVRERYVARMTKQLDSL